MIFITIYALVAVFLYKVFYNMWAKKYEYEGPLNSVKEQYHADSVSLSVMAAVFWIAVVPVLLLRVLYKRSNTLINLNQSLNEMASKVAEKLK